MYFARVVHITKQDSQLYIRYLICKQHTLAPRPRIETIGHKSLMTGIVCSTAEIYELVKKDAQNVLLDLKYFAPVVEALGRIDLYDEETS